jgi:hypothetical protein
MSRRKRPVLDANILLRAVFGQRVRKLFSYFNDLSETPGISSTPLKMIL